MGLYLDSGDSVMDDLLGETRFCTVNSQTVPIGSFTVNRKRGRLKKDWNAGC